MNRSLVRWSGAWMLLGAVVVGVAQTLPAPRGNVLFFDADPFGSDAAVCLGGTVLGDWSVGAAGAPGGWRLRAARQAVDGGPLGMSIEVAVGTVPEATRFLLVNQPEPDVSVFNFAVPARGVDSDENGLPDAWERRFFGVTGVRALDDADGDGASNAEEADAGTDPLRRDSAPGLEEGRPTLEAEVQGGWVHLRWPSRWARHRVQSAIRLEAGEESGWRTLRCEQAPPGLSLEKVQEAWIPAEPEGRFFRLAASGVAPGARVEAPDGTGCFPEGLLGLWKGEGNADDSFGGHHGAWTGPSAYGAGRSGRAFRFDGRGRAMIRIPDAPGLHADEFTVTAWIQPELDSVRPLEGFAPGGLVFGKLLSRERGHLAFALRAAPVPGILGYIQGYSPNGALLNATRAHWWVANTNTWYHLAMRVRSNAVTLFLNGVPLPDSTRSAVDFGVAWDSGDFCIGGAPFAGLAPEFTSAFRGLVDDVALFGRALSAAELEALAAMDPIAARIPSGSALIGLADETIWSMTPDGLEFRFVTVGAQPRLSADSRRILFRRRDGSPGGQILVRDLETGREQLVHSQGIWVSGYSWFPDSAHVALDDFNLGPSRQGFRALEVEAGLPGVEMLARHPWDFGPIISPDGSEVIFETGANAGPDLVGVQIGSVQAGYRVTDIHRLPGTGPSDSRPKWSRDGRSVSVSDHRNLAVVDARSGTRRGVTRAQQPGDGFAGPAPFTPEGQAVLAAGVLDGVRGIYRIPLNQGGEPMLLRTTPRFEGGSPDAVDEVGGVAGPWK